MKNKFIAGIFTGLLIFAAIATVGSVIAETTDDTITVTDSFGRTVTIPAFVEKIAISGSGSMRFPTYLDVDLEKIVGIDWSDSSLNEYPEDPRPYIIANPDILKIAALGSSRGDVDQEILLKSGADVLLIASNDGTNAAEADEITVNTGIPVILFYSGDYATNTEKVQKSLKLLAGIFGKEQRYTELIENFTKFEDEIISLVAGADSPNVKAYVGGVSHSGEHGLDGTDPNYLAFKLLNINNVATSIPDIGTNTYAQVAKEQILDWNPDIIFVGLGTLNAADGGAIYELQNDASYKELDAVKSGEIYTVNPDLAVGANYETNLANVYYVGKVLYPEQFADIDPTKKADEIYSAIVGGNVFDRLNSNLKGLSYQKVDLSTA